MTKPETPVRTEIRAIVDEAKRAGKPITARIIWGLLSRDIPERSFTATLSFMVRDRQLVLERHCYTPGPEPVTETRARPTLGFGLLGNMAMKRLVSARKEARRWAANA